MKLVTLLPRSGTVERTSEPAGPEELQREWDHLRDAAGSQAERTEIDTVFSREMP